MPKAISIPLLIIFIIGLYWSLNKVIVPFVLKITASDLFFEKETEQEELGKISNERTKAAFDQCKVAMKEQKHVPDNAQFADTEYEAWALGGKMYLIRSHVGVSANGKVTDQKYACKIRLTGEKLADSASWAILGVDFNMDEN